MGVVLLQSKTLMSIFLLKRCGCIIVAYYSEKKLKIKKKIMKSGQKGFFLT